VTREEKKDIQSLSLNKNTMNIFESQKLKKLRRQYSLSQKELAELLGGVSEKMLGRIERGRKAINIDLLHKVKFVFGLPSKYFTKASYDKAMNEVFEGIQNLKGKWSGKSDPVSKQKQELLQAIEGRMALEEHRQDIYDKDGNSLKD
jgi:transcriptional regulator with XRE-family HTH domain